MNRVYKVIWSKAKHCYVVTSEIARSVTKSASSARSAGRKGAAVLAMAALLFTAGGVLGEAANVTDITVNDKGNVITVTKDVGDPTPITIDNVAHATEAGYALKATGDGNGEVIHKIYARKTDAKDNLKVGDDGVISKVTGDDGTTSSPVNKLVLNKDGKNQITLSEDGIKVGKNSTTMDEKGIYAGSDYDYGTAKAALDATEGKIRGADGNFQVNADGKVTAKGGVDTDGREILTHNGNINAGSGDISGKNISASGNLHADGDISGKDISGKDITGSGTVRGRVVTDGTASMEGGKVQGTSVSDGVATLSGGSLTDAVNITASGTITGNDVVVKGKLTTTGLETDRVTLGSETPNQTDIYQGNVTSKVNETVSGVEYTAESIFNKDGSSITARTDVGEHADSTGKSIVGAKKISQYLGDAAEPDASQKNVTRSMVRNGDNFSMEDTAVDGDKSSTVSQNAGERKVTVAEGTKNLNVTENLTNGIVSETNGGAGKTVTLTQGMDGTYKVVTSGTSTEEIGGKKIENYKGGLDTNITGNETHHVTKNQTITVDGTLEETVKGKVTEDYQDALETTVGTNETHYVKGNQTNTVDGTLEETVKENVTEDYQKDLSTTVGGNQTTTVTGDSSLSAKNITNTASEKITNQIGNGSAVKSEMTAKGITNTAKEGTIYNKSKDILNEASGDIINWADGEIGNVATKITNITGDNTVTSDTNGTTFENKAHNTAVKEGTVTKTTISGNTIETGQATMDYADVTKDLSVGGNATVENDLTVKGASEFIGRADFRYDVYVDNNLTVAKETRTDTLYVDHDGYVGGNLNVDGNIETHDAVLSADSRQVVTGRQLYQTNERVDRLDNRIKKVGANAAALAALRPGDFNPDDKFSIAAGFGSYRNANAAALGLFYRPNENVLLSLGTSFGDGENMVNAGVSVKFGRGKSMAERRKEMADEVSSMRDEMRSQDERIAELEEMLKKQSELIEKLSKES